MNELERALVGNSAHTPPSHILEGLTDELVHRLPDGAPRSIYEELWHICFWQQITLEWIAGTETPYPDSPRDAFPTVQDAEREYWPQLCERLLAGSRRAADLTQAEAGLSRLIRCTSHPPNPPRTMTVREQFESLAAHNAYHFGRIVLLRQLLGAWPPPSGGFTW